MLLVASRSGHFNENWHFGLYLSAGFEDHALMSQKILGSVKNHENRGGKGNPVLQPEKRTGIH